MEDHKNMRLVEIKTAMLLHVPFCASILLDQMTLHVGKYPEIFAGITPTAATDGKHIWFDKDFIEGLTLPEAVFVTCHEVMHFIWMHLPRAKEYADQGTFDGKPFSRELWNVAGDYIINAALVEGGIGTMPKIGLLDQKRFNGQMLTDNVYRDLYKEAEKQAGSGGVGKGEGKDGKGNSGKTLDVHMDPNHEMPTPAEVARAVTTAREAAKAMGKMPASLERLVGELLAPKVTWRERLRHVITRAATREMKTWNRPNRRRLLMQKTYYPAYTGVGCGQIVVAQDSSGSMGQREYTAGLSELADIITTCRPESVTFLSCDAKVHTVEEFGPDDDISERPPKIIGGGGTSFVPVFDWVEENGVEPVVLIYFTDMYGTFPSEPPPYPVLWVSSTAGIEGPFGETIHIDISGDHNG